MSVSCNIITQGNVSEMNQFHHVFSFFFTISLRSAINFSIRHIFPIFKCFTQSVSNLVGAYWGGRLQTIIIVFIINDENPGSSVGKTVTFTVVFFFFFRCWYSIENNRVDTLQNVLDDFSAFYRRLKYTWFLCGLRRKNCIGQAQMLDNNTRDSS